ncbi:MAG TPA: hypothetical protein PK573_03525 [Spirochaetota bacterium]|nr:hypothetical protein [Spirochaetota bacterium]HRZ26940.1 hypothetical protein [Spirochaetota bacterium]HSA15347.1 hypothetical protein [Spirochaetota bacterium]
MINCIIERTTMETIERPALSDFVKSVGISGNDDLESIVLSIWEDYNAIYWGIRNRTINFSFNSGLFRDVIGETITDQECLLMSEHLRQEIIEHPSRMASFTKFLCMGVISMNGN